MAVRRRGHALGARRTAALALVAMACAGACAAAPTPAPAMGAASLPEAGGTAASGQSPAPAAADAPRATVLEAQSLFHELGYPVGGDRRGELGVRTRGALSYFQHKYGLPVTGYPDARTLAEMQAVAASLRGSPNVAGSTPHDAVEGVLGANPPVLVIAVALAAIVALLALSARRRAAQDSAAAEDAIVPLSEDS